MQHINGCFDNVVDDTVEGWAFNPQFPESAQIVSLFIDFPIPGYKPPPVSQ